MFRWLIRIAFIALLGFEIANYLNIFHFTLDYTWLGLMITSLVVFVGLEFIGYSLRRKWRTTLHPFVWPLAFAVVAFDAFGDILHFYSRWSWYDQFGHFFGAAVVAIILLTIFIAIEKAHGWQHPHHVNLLLALGLTITLAVLYEIEEYLEDFANLTNRLGDGRDTANDLFMNLLGALAVVLMVAAHRAHERHK